MVQATPLTDLLYNYAPPNSLDLAIIQDITEAMAKRIAKLRDELKPLEEQLHLYKCVIAPARRIPTEVLTIIFDLVTAKPPWSAYDDDWGRDKKCLASITLVCKRWRDVAYNSGGLWAVREVEIPTLTQKQCGTLLQWYGRSKGTPKTLKIDSPYRIETPCECYKQTGGTQLCSNAVLKRLLEEGAPFSQISMAQFTPTCFKNIVRYIKSTNRPNSAASTTTARTSHHWWDKVQKLMLDFHCGGGNDNDPYWLQSQLPAESIFTSFPDSLTSLTLHLHHLGNKGQRKILEIPAVVLRKLITFSLTYPWGGPQFLTALQHCTSVENLTLSLRHNGRFQANWADRVNVTALSQDGHLVLPKVKSLRLKVTGANEVMEDLSFLRFPGLMELSFESEVVGYGEPEPYSTVLKAIGLFSPYAPQSFTSLTLVGEIDAEDLYHLLGSITSPITHFTTDADFNPGMFLELAQDTPAGTPNLLPSLQSLEVRNFPSDFDLESLFLYIKSRQKHGKKKGKIVMKAPYDQLKWVMLEITGSERELQKAYCKESATLKMLRESFGIKVDRMGYDPELESDT
ncbi:hypothetical protein D9611_013277 [Ephemerocybe angulata]|uniref:F-box domain-containing protein n=1 Tax=Ephemerocybe angulata TaxID=980116 RepID=A0A8H5CDG3_9AGAR|nr:hypothetical protein D9611_013277 [Tulosesus angulatus]